LEIYKDGYNDGFTDGFADGFLNGIGCALFFMWVGLMVSIFVGR
jgi:hypothetical protein